MTAAAEKRLTPHRRERSQALRVSPPPQGPERWGLWVPLRSSMFQEPPSAPGTSLDDAVAMSQWAAVGSGGVAMVSQWVGDMAPRQV